MNITLSVNEDVLKRARTVAHAMGKSVNELVREYLQQLANTSDARSDVEELRRLSVQGAGRSHGWRFDRNEIHARS